MLWQRVESEGLAHYSYLVGRDGEALVVDPRVDVDVYEDLLARSGHRLRYIFETHRHEDFLVGSVELASRTGAEIWHADSQLEYAYGEAAQEGQEWQIGSLRIRALLTPGHTAGHLSYVLSDQGGSPWAVFTGDALFAGGVGRTDLAGADMVDELTQQLFHSVTARLLPLGDGVLLCPAHGPGSVCGAGPIADRAWSTIGYEREHNPALGLDEKTFVHRHAQRLDVPPYFPLMEKRNLEGVRLPGGLPRPTPLSPDGFDEARSTSQILDVREVVAVGGAHVPGSLCIPQSEAPLFAGWFLAHEQPLLAVLAGSDPEPLVRALVRLGYDRFTGYLAGGLQAWYSAGLPINQIECLTVADAHARWSEDEGVRVLDVRSPQELETSGQITGAVNVPVREVVDRLDEIPRGNLMIFCGSGRRSMIAASLLRQRGWEKLSVVLGGIQAWNSIAGAPATQ